MRRTIDSEYEDAGLMELMDEMDSLRRTYDRLLAPETPTTTTPATAAVIPPEAVDAMLQMVPEGWRGIAGLAVRRLLSDPARMEELKQKLLPYFQKAQGAQQQAPPSGNQGVLQQAGIPSEYYHGYDPNNPPPRKWPVQ